MPTELIIGLGAVLLIVLVFIISNIRIVPQSKAYVMERLGVYSKTWQTGLHVKIPFIEKISKKVDLKEQILVCGEGFNHGQYRNTGSGYRYSKRVGDGSAEFGGILTDVNVANLAAVDGMGVGSGLTANSKKARSTMSMVSANNSKIEVDDVYTGTGSASAKFQSGKVEGWVKNDKRVHNRLSQPVITKDNVSMDIDTVVFYQVTDPKLFAYGHANPIKAIEHLSATTLRNIVGGLELDETLTSRDLINSKMRTILDEATDAWGIKITRVELRNIIVSDAELAEAMEKQMIAEREKRAAILRAEGISQAEILEAQGKAEAIRLVNEAKPSKEFLTIRALEAYEVASHGQATKIIVPSEIQSLAGLALSGSEVFKEGEKMAE